MAVSFYFLHISIRSEFCCLKDFFLDYGDTYMVFSALLYEFSWSKVDVSYLDKMSFEFMTFLLIIL